jgi:hypothetical protein
LTQQKQKFIEEYQRWDYIRNEKERENEAETNRRLTRKGEKEEAIGIYNEE